MGLLNRLFRRDRTSESQVDEARIDEAIARVVAIHPRLKLASRYRDRLKQPVATALQYIEHLVASLPAPFDANPNAWADNPSLRAFFATSDDIIHAFARSDEVRGFFERNPGSVDVYCTLGMAMTERHTLGAAQQGDSIHLDVPQTTLCFSDHRLRICGASVSLLNEEIERRLIDQLALEGLASPAANRAERVARGRELMEQRVALLQRQGTGIRSIVGGDAVAESDEMARVQMQIVQNADSLAALRVPTDIIELEIDGVREVLSKPADYLSISSRHILIDMMNVVQQAVAPRGRDVQFYFARIPGPTPRMRAFALVHFSRSAMPPGGLHIDAAMRAL